MLFEAKVPQQPPQPPVAQQESASCVTTFYGQFRNTLAERAVNEDDHLVLAKQETVTVPNLVSLPTRANRVATSVTGTTDREGRLRNTAVQVCKTKQPGSFAVSIWQRMLGK